MSSTSICRRCRQSWAPGRVQDHFCCRVGAPFMRPVPSMCLHYHRPYSPSGWSTSGSRALPSSPRMGGVERRLRWAPRWAARTASGRNPGLGGLHRTRSRPCTASHCPSKPPGSVSPLATKPGGSKAGKPGRTSCPSRCLRHNTANFLALFCTMPHLGPNTAKFEHEYGQFRYSEEQREGNRRKGAAAGSIHPHLG